MKSIKFFFYFVFSIPMCFWAQNKATITIENNSALDRKEVVVAISWKNILERYPEIDTSNFVVINPKTKKQVIFQLEHRMFSVIQNLLVQVDLKAKSKLPLFVQKGKPDVFTIKTYARYVPERKDDFAWENDHIAFRTYGKAIEGSNEDAYGFDVWVKRTNKMVINERYKRADYHTDHGDGLDYYQVGHTLGAGNMAPYVKDTIRYSANYHRWKMLDNGPLRSTFQLIYDSWNAGGIKIGVIKTISLDAGSQLSRIENSYTFNETQALPVVAGISKRANPGKILLNEQQGIMAYWEPASDKNGTTATGVILTTPVSNMWADKIQLLAKTTVQNNDSIIYYAGAAWDKAGKFTDAKKWFDYLENFYHEINNPLVISVQ
ncbi:DUF4861 family protein [Flavobacterium hibisci]|uniref:DUF4861 family protein n=1 Tax=Flavobacterium hibisci TaxID=1914462 RepID=UPI001CBD5058|nr:DUF4861 family protein [Flavobacterium hibisci]MBZ4041058.1 DUF4861 domain-containing protein [Flavobacterium hibisci]